MVSRARRWALPQAQQVTRPSVSGWPDFSAKADLFFDEASDILAELLAAVRYGGRRAAGPGRGGHIRGRPGGRRNSPPGRSASSSPAAACCRPTRG